MSALGEQTRDPAEAPPRARIMFAIPALAALVTALSGSALLAAPHGFAVHDVPKAVPEIVSADGDGRRTTLDDFAGRTILLNVWATWCPPCIEEMPTLDALQSTLGGEGFKVLALSVDRAAVMHETSLTHVTMHVPERAPRTRGQTLAEMNENALSLVLHVS